METWLKNILFLDIETVSAKSSFTELDERFQKVWTKKAQLLNPDCSDIPGYYFEKAGIYAEFGKIIVVGVGYFHSNEQGELCFRTKSIADDNEKKLLMGFLELLTHFPQDDLFLCAHNGKEFDFPYLCRRLLVNGLALPPCLQMSGRKPWQVKHYDTLEMWKFGDRKNFTSLELLAAVFGITSSKSGIDGSMVNKAYYEGGQLEIVADYCRRDVIVLALLFLKMHALSLPKEENIIAID